MPKAVVQATPLTPKQFVAQWQLLPTRLDLNIWDFEVSVGKEAVDIFQKSFDMRRFNTKGSRPWKLRTKNNRGGYPRGSLTESLSLYSSIKYEVESHSKSKGKIKVFTDPAAFQGTFSHKGFCFAAVHNSDNSSVRRGRVKNMPQRQFMPTEKRDSTVMNDKLKELELLIFRNFPGRTI